MIWEKAHRASLPSPKAVLSRNLLTFSCLVGLRIWVLWRPHCTDVTANRLQGWGIQQGLYVQILLGFSEQHSSPQGIGPRPSGMKGVFWPNIRVGKSELWGRNQGRKKYIYHIIVPYTCHIFVYYNISRNNKEKNWGTWSFWFMWRKQISPM